MQIDQSLSFHGPKSLAELKFLKAQRIAEAQSFSEGSSSPIHENQYQLAH